MNLRLAVTVLFGVSVLIVLPDYSAMTDSNELSSLVSEAEACGVKVAVKAAPPKRTLKKRKARKPVKRGGSRVAVRKKVRQKSARTPITSGPKRSARTPKRNKRPANSSAKKRARVAAAEPAEPARVDDAIEDEDATDSAPQVSEKPAKRAKKRVRSAPIDASPAETPAIVIEVYFERGSASLTEEAEEALAEQVAWLKDNPNGSIQIEGHTDPVGSRRKNKQLSIDRANSVREFLAEQASVDADRIESRGFGETRPRYRRSNPKNRRVVVQGRL